jgi:polar amino acid transport system substrate-binding protein
MRTERRRSALLVAGILSTFMLAGCTSTSDQSEPNPSGSSSGPQGAVAAASTTCKDGRRDVASVAPGKITLNAASWGAGSTMAAIKKRGYLIVGTSGDARLWGARNPVNGKIEGYDVDVAARVARALGLNPARTVYKVLAIADRVPALKSRTVDLVAERMTISCDRWQGSAADPTSYVNLSTPYYTAAARLMVRTDSRATSLKGLIAQKQTVCGVKGSTSLQALENGVADLEKSAGGELKTVIVSETGRCLVKFQEGEADAVVGDDTTLAGLASQDQYAKIDGPRLNSSPIGLGLNAETTDFTQFVNAVLAQMRADGSLTALYNKWMKPTVKEAAPAVPAAVYGRDVTGLKRQS